MTTTLQRELARIPARVARGVKLLDKERPGWRKSINRRKLQMNDCDRCVLGQLFGSFSRGLSAVCWGDDAVEFGFAADNDYSALTAEWRRVLAEKSK